ncbi:protein YLS7-like, partial [Trifolium medium]|nr:protein YLS7-like [Trifolium medium]
MMLWSRFLIVGEERMVNGTGTSVFDLNFDKIDEDWAKVIPELDYAIISDGHWYFRLMYLHQGALNYINNCKECKKGKLLTILRTFAPAHFENGVWNTGGYCNRTSPMNE